MAMIKCKECGHDVSDKAISCPSCGVKISGNENSFNALHIGASTIMTLAGLIIGASGISTGGWILFFIGLVYFIITRISSSTN